MDEPDAAGAPDADQPDDESMGGATSSVLDDVAGGGAVPDVDDLADGTGLDASTGHAVVDDVVRSLGGLDDLPVAEHVQVFERAHDSLRRALSDAGDSGQPERG